MQCADGNDARKGVLIFLTPGHYALCCQTKDLAVPLNIRDETVNRLAEKLAERTHRSKTDAVRQALENELRRLDSVVPMRDRLRPLQDRVLSRPATGLEADKVFYDALGGEE